MCRGSKGHPNDSSVISPTCHLSIWPSLSAISSQSDLQLKGVMRTTGRMRPFFYIHRWPGNDRANKQPSQGDWRGERAAAHQNMSPRRNERDNRSRGFP